jgi:hypothetical protein
MLILKARAFGSMCAGLMEVEQFVSHLPPNKSLEEMVESMRIMCGNLQRYLDGLELPTTREAVNGLGSAVKMDDIQFAVRNVRETLFNELTGRNFYGMQSKYVTYFENPKLFGDAVFSAFPSANEDITEAGSCLALERATACVMHMFRASEIALKALAKAVNVGPQNDWGSYIRLIERELEQRKKSSGARSADEQFYAEAAANFDSMKRAWRNPTMHPEKTYSPERAEEILRSVQSFMAHLAAKIKE